MEDLTFRIVALFGGIQVVLTGLVSFLGRIWLNRIQEKEKGRLNKELETLKSGLQATNERLKAALETSVHIHKVQFDNEYRIYGELWEKVNQVKGAIISLSLYTSTPNGVGPSWEERNQEYKDAYKAFYYLVEHNRPFFSAEIWKQLSEFMTLLNEVADSDKEARKSDPMTIPDPKQALLKLAVIQNTIDQICESIRDRITRTVVDG